MSSPAVNIGNKKPQHTQSALTTLPFLLAHALTTASAVLRVTRHAPRYTVVLNKDPSL